MPTGFTFDAYRIKNERLLEEYRSPFSRLFETFLQFLVRQFRNNGFSIRSKIRLLAGEKRSEQVVQRIDLTAEVKKAFYNILLAEQSLAVLRESEATVQRTVDDTQVQYKHGLASEYDLLTAQVQLSNLKPTILQTENSIKLAKLMLKMYLSIPEQVEIEVSDGKIDATVNSGKIWQKKK